MLLQETDIYTRLYAENVAEIVREDDSLIDRAIQAAENEAKMYLSRFDIPALFGTDTEPPTFPDSFLKQICVSLAVWHLIMLGNPNIHYDTAKTNYDTARSQLRDIQAGKAQPYGWPYRNISEDTAQPGTTVSAFYNNRRANDY